MEPDASKWGVNFPNQYSTLLLTKDNTIRTTNGGSDQFSHLEDNPRLVTLFAGYAFSKDYNEDRGHLNSLELAAQTAARVPAGAPARSSPDLSTMTPEQKIRHGLAARG